MFSKKYRFVVFISLSLLLSGQHIMAENVIKLSLRESIIIALDKNETILKEARNSLESARLGLVSTYKGYMPRIGLDISAEKSGTESDLSSKTNSSNPSSSSTSNKYTGGLLFNWSKPVLSGSLLSLGGGYNLSHVDPAQGDDSAANLSMSLDLRQPLSHGGRLRETATLRMAEDGLVAAQMQYKEILQDLILKVIYGYYELVRTGLTVEEAEEEVKRTEKLLKWSQVKLEIGQIARVEKMKVEVQLASVRDSLIQAIESQKDARRSFLRLLGLKEDREVDYDPTVEISPITLSKEECVKMALDNRLEIKMAEMALELARLNIPMVESEGKPVLNLKGSYGLSGTGEDLMESTKEFPERSWSISGSISFPFFDSGLTKIKVKKTRLSYQSSEEAVEELRKDIVEEVEKIYEEIEKDLKRIDSLSVNLKIAEDVLSINQKKYEMGIAAVRDVLEAQMVYLGMKRAIQSARISYSLDRAKLFKAIGMLESEYI